MRKGPDDEAQRGSIPQRGCDRGATKSDCFLRENPSGGGSFGRIRRLLGPYSPLRGSSVLAALAAAKFPRRRTPRSFQTGSLHHARQRVKNNAKGIRREDAKIFDRVDKIYRITGSKMRDNLPEEALIPPDAKNDVAAR